MTGGRIPLTKEGYEKLQREFQELKSKRREISNDIGEARAKGDLSENAEYHAAREAQAMNERKVAEIEDILSRATIIDDTDLSVDEARLGMTVRLKDEETGEELEYRLVSEEESDYDLNKISVSSPVGNALLGHKVGDVVEIKVPAGVFTYKVIEISKG